MISIIVAVGNQGQIGLNNKLPWLLKDDLENFKRLTLNNVIIMGRKTFESIGKILPNRINVVITKNSNYNFNHNGVYVFNDLYLAIENFKNKNIFICGGEEIYKEVLNGNYFIDRLYITNVDYNGPADTFFPKINYGDWKLIEEKKYFSGVKNQYNFSFNVFERR